MTNTLLSPCHDAIIDSSRGDGVTIGSCSICYENVVRLNDRTGLQEWLDGASPWTTEELRPVDDEHQNPAALAFRPVFGLRSPCHDQPPQFVTYPGPLRVRIGVCSEWRCTRAFVRISPDSGRIEYIDSELFAVTDDPLIEVPAIYQPLSLDSV